MPEAVINEEEEYYTQDLDYLDYLNTTLKGFRGFKTMAFELIQNADDAKAKWIEFDFHDTHLLIKNSALFQLCNDLRPAKCPWITEGIQKFACDFHRFRKVAGGGKRLEAGTIGNFGIGFISVYAYTDRPVIQSADRIWEVDPGEEDSSKRIRGTRGKALEWTSITLPWTKDPYTKIRSRLGGTTIESEDINTFIEEILPFLEVSVLFLDDLDEIIVRRSGQLVCSVRRAAHNDSHKLERRQKAEDGGEQLVESEWRLYQGEFASQAAELRKKYNTTQETIEQKRRSEVTLAFTADSKRKGRIFAFLPTDVETGLPFHINADFYPAPERKTIILSGNSYEQHWNQAALCCAAELISKIAPELAATVGHKRFFEILNRLYDLREHEHYGIFWEKLEPQLKQSRIVYTAKETWEIPSRTVQRYVASGDMLAAQVYRHLGLEPVHSDLRPYHNLLSTIGTKHPDLDAFCKLLEPLLGGDRKKKSEWHELLKVDHLREAMYSEIQLLQEIRKSVRLQSLPIGIADGINYKLNELFLADHETKALFSKSGVLFADEKAMFGERIELSRLLDAFGVEDAVQCLKHQKTVPVSADHNRIHLWFARHVDRILSEPDLRARYFSLRLFHADGEIKTMNGLYLPTAGLDRFPFALKNILTLTGLDPSVRTFWERLGVKALNWPVQVKMLAEYIAHNSVTESHLIGIIDELSANQKHFRSDRDAIDALRACPLVPCRDKTNRCAKDVYLHKELTVELLGNSVGYLSGLVSIEDKEKSTFLFGLGLNSNPDSAALVKCIKETVQGVPSKKPKLKIRRILEHLSNNWSKFNKEDKETFSALQSISWLPATTISSSEMLRWHSPAQVFLPEKQRLFLSQARFLDPDLELNADLLKFLGIKTDPTYLQVAEHLLWCVDNDRKDLVDLSIYRFLDEKLAQGISIVQSKLADKPCLLIERDKNAKWMKGKDLFWRGNIDPWRIQLPADFKKYNDLFSAVGVREEPTSDDFVDVLLDISNAYGRTNSPLTTSDQSIVHYCLSRIDQVIGDNPPKSIERLLGKKIVPNETSIILCDPGQLYFKDNPQLAERFRTKLADNLISMREDTLQILTYLKVKSLNDETDRKLVILEGPTPNHDLTKRIRERESLIQQIFNRELKNRHWNKQQLSQIMVYSASRMQERLSLRSVNVATDTMDADSFLDKKQSLIYLSRNTKKDIFNLLAKELVQALTPADSSTQLVFTFMAILKASTFSEARDLLIECGLEDIKEARTVEVPSTQPGEISLAGNLDSQISIAQKHGNFDDNELDDTEDEVPSTRQAQGQKELSLSPLQASRLPNSKNDPTATTKTVSYLQPSAHKSNSKTPNAANGPAREVNTSQSVESDETFQNGVQKRFDSRNSRALQNDPSVIDVPQGPIKDVARYREKIKEEIRKARVEEPPKETRFSWRPTKVWDQKDSQVREFLLQQYQGQCQICKFTFRTASDYNYFEAPYLVPYTSAKWIDHPGNALCLCANCCAKFQYGNLHCADGSIINSLRQLNPADEEPQWLRIVLCGQGDGIRFTQRHVVMLQALLDSKLE